MSPEPPIRSRSNSLLKRVGAALAGKDRGMVVLEGERLVEEALRCGMKLEALLVAEDRARRGAELTELYGRREVPVRAVEAELLSRVSALETSPGILALGPHPARRSLDELASTRVPLLLVVAGVADPGNLGALARSAEAAGAGAIVVVRGGARAFGGKALRGSMGSLLRLPVFEGHEGSELADALRAKGYRQVHAATRGGKPFTDFDWTPPIALWVSGETGTELEGFQGFEPITIPMRGEVESLNVTVAASLLLFAAGAER